MSEYLFNNPEDKNFETNELELEEFFSSINDFFGKNIFLLDKTEQSKIIKQKVTSMFKANDVRIDLMRLGQILDSKIDLLETEIKNGPENLIMQRTISELKEQREQTKKLFEMCKYA